MRSAESEAKCLHLGKLGAAERTKPHGWHGGDFLSSIGVAKITWHINILALSAIVLVH
jgi:hypothetical protein